jgi:hypothetical protein
LADSSVVQNVEKASSNLIIANIIEKVFYYKDYNERLKDTLISGFDIHFFAGKNMLLSFNNKKIIIIRDRKLLSYTCRDTQYVDCVFVSEKLKTYLLNFDKYFKTRFLVIENGRKQSEIASSNLIKKLKTHIIFIEQQGAFKADL